MEFYVICSLTAIICFIILSRYPHRRRRPKTKHSIISTSSVVAILQPPRATLHDQVRARAAPNARLVRAFGLTNTFVSDALDVRKEFRSSVSGLLKQVDARGWPHFISIADRAINTFLPTSTTPFDTFIQAVTLSVIISGLLGVDIDAADPDDIIFIAKRITELWQLSKTPTALSPVLREQLTACLARILPGYAQPLNIIIPAWETLWRVVAVSLAHIHADPAVQHTFNDFYDNPTTTQFATRSAHDTSVESVVIEALRLHPPTGHISRARPGPLPLHAYTPSFLLPFVRMLFPPTLETEIADIAAVQRSAVWGPNAAVFDPARHGPARLQSRQKDTLLMFGYGQLRCIAYAWAPMAAGAIMAAVLHRVNGKEYRIVEGTKIGGRVGWDGWSVVRSDP